MPVLQCHKKKKKNLKSKKQFKTKQKKAFVKWMQQKKEFFNTSTPNACKTYR